MMMMMMMTTRRRRRMTMVPLLNLPPHPRKDHGKDERCTRFKNAYSRMASMEISWSL